MNTPQRLRVAFVITELEPGGAERCLVHVATGLDRGRFEAAVYSIASRPEPGRDQLVEQLEAADVPVTFLDADSPRHVLGAARRLRRELRQLQADVVQTFLFHANVLGTIASCCLPSRVMLGIRVADPSRWRARLERWAARRAERVVCVSASVADHASGVAKIPTEKLVVIPNGVDCDLYRPHSPGDKTKLGFATDSRLLLAVGRLHPQKGLDWLLQQLPAIFRTVPDCNLLIAGDGPERARLEHLADKLHIADRVHFLGWRTDVPRVMQAADLLLLPSRWEGMPNVLLEAMAAGLPVVASNVEGVGEVLGAGAAEQGVRPGDGAGFQDKLQRLLTDDALATRLGRKNRHVAEGNFSLDAMIRRYQDLYTEVSAKDGLPKF